MPVLSKSKLIAYRQCPKRLWLEVHRPELREDSSRTKASFAIGHSVGDRARRVYDPDGQGSFLDIQVLGVGGVIDKTRELLPQRRMIFEAGFSIGDRSRGALALADVLLPDRDGKSWHMVEVKSSTRVHAYHEDDAAIQFHIATGAGVSLKSVKVAHVDKRWVYPGGDDYKGMLMEQDVTEQAATRSAEVARWLNDAHDIVASATPPAQCMGSHCTKPFACGFERTCRGVGPKEAMP